MKGRRVAWPKGSKDMPPLAAGDYTKHPSGERWYLVTPNGHFGGIDRGPNGWTITEHEDGSITASPSIHVQGGKGGKVSLWHGYLERGVWRSC